MNSAEQHMVYCTPFLLLEKNRLQHSARYDVFLSSLIRFSLIRARRSGAAEGGGA